MFNEAKKNQLCIHKRKKKLSLVWIVRHFWFRASRHHSAMSSEEHSLGEYRTFTSKGDSHRQQFSYKQDVKLDSLVQKKPEKKWLCSAIWVFVVVYCCCSKDSTPQLIRPLWAYFCCIYPSFFLLHFLLGNCLTLLSAIFRKGPFHRWPPCRTGATLIRNPE